MKWCFLILGLSCRTLPLSTPNADYLLSVKCSLPLFCVPDGPPSSGFEKKMPVTRGDWLPLLIRRLVNNFTGLDFYWFWCVISKWIMSYIYVKVKSSWLGDFLCPKSLIKTIFKWIKCNSSTSVSSWGYINSLDNYTIFTTITQSAIIWFWFNAIDSI